MKTTELYESIFDGDLCVFDSPAAAGELVSKARGLVASLFGSEPERLDSESFLEALAGARQTLQEPCYKDLAARCLHELGVDLSAVKLDTIRLRAVVPGLENVEQAAPVFYCHRDTWYGNPNCQVNVWLPLHEVDRSNSFRFFLDYFKMSVANDSHHFIAKNFAEDGGFGRVDGGSVSVYPRALIKPSGNTRDVDMTADQLLLFAAAHLHQTQPNLTRKVRFSLDFRFFDQGHLLSGIGAPDPDNQSRGLMIEDYQPCV